MAFIDILRPKNLLLIVVTQFILQYFVIIPGATGSIVLSDLTFFIFILDTLLIAAGGYVINDIYDYKIDSVNKPQLTYIPAKISLKTAWIYYFIIIKLGLVIALLIAIKTHTMQYIWLYPLAAFMMYLYALKLKSSVLFGNIIVSLFVAFVWGVLFLAQSIGENNLGLNVERNLYFSEFCWIYMTFAFFTNMIREVLKDIEDFEGDSLMNIKTLPVKYGIDITKYVLYLLITMLATILMFWIFISTLSNDFTIRVYFIIFIISPLLLMLMKIKNAAIKNDFSNLSKMTKWIMFSGLISIVLIAKTIFTAN